MKHAHDATGLAWPIHGASKWRKAGPPALVKLEMFCFSSGMFLQSDPGVRSSAFLRVWRFKGFNIFRRRSGISMRNQLISHPVDWVDVTASNPLVECCHAPAWRLAFAAAIRGGK
jgi:hypothetical protein